MSETTIVTTWEDLYTALLRDMRAEAGVTITTNLAKRYIDEAHLGLYVGHGEKFWWAERHAFLKTQPEYTDGTLSATQGNGTLTGSGTLWNTANGHGVVNVRIGGRIEVSGDEVVYTVTGVTSDTSITVSPTYVGETDTGLSYRYFEDEYDLPLDFIKPVDAQSFDDGHQVHLVDRMDFRKRFPRHRVTSQIVNYATFPGAAPTTSTSIPRRIRFGPIPSTVQVIPYTYVSRFFVVDEDGALKTSFTADTDEPTMPLLYRPTIVAGAKWIWYRDQKDDRRAQSAEVDYARRLGGMTGDQDYGARGTTFHSPFNRYRERARQPYARAGRQYDINGKFDRFDDD